MFYDDDELSVPWQIINIFIDSLFWIDLVISMLTTKENKDGNLETSWKAVISNYLRKWFIVDFLAGFPF